MVSVTGPVALCCGFELSVTVTVAVEVPGVVGVPVTVHPVNVNPAGRAPPVIEQVYGPIPPVIPIGALYGVPAVPFGRGVGEIVNGPPPPPEVMVRLIGPVVLCCGFEASVTLTVMFEVPARTGVPLTVHPFNVRPAGRTPDVIVQAYGVVPPVMPIAWL